MVTTINSFHIFLKFELDLINKCNCYFSNSYYKVIKKLTAKKGFTSDVQEFTITKRNTALFSAVRHNNIRDCFHVNSIDEGPNNTLLISMRNMLAINNIDKETGNIIWQLGGKKSDFTFGPNATFSWQHDARHRHENRISMFDDACCASSSSPPQCQAHGLILHLDYKNMTAKVDRMYYYDPKLYVQIQGNVQKLSICGQVIGTSCIAQVK